MVLLFHELPGFMIIPVDETWNITEARFKTSQGGGEFSIYEDGVTIPGYSIMVISDIPISQDGDAADLADNSQLSFYISPAVTVTNITISIRIKKTRI